MKRKLLSACFILAAAASSVAAPRPEPSDGRNRPQPLRLVRDEYKVGNRTLVISGLPYERGTMEVGLEYAGENGVERRVLVSSVHFRAYEPVLRKFFSLVAPDFAGQVRKDFETRLLAEAASAAPPQSRDRAQLTLMELGIFSIAHSVQASNPHTARPEGVADCAKIAAVAVHISACLVGTPAGPVEWTACTVSLVEAGFAFLDVEGCLDTIGQLICESNGYPAKWIPGNSGQAGWCIDCYDQDAHACDMVVSALDGGGGGEIERGPDMQDPGSGGGGGGGSSFYYWGTPGGTVSTGVCYVIPLPNGGTYVNCH